MVLLFVVVVMVLLFMLVVMMVLSRLELNKLVSHHLFVGPQETDYRPQGFRTTYHVNFYFF